MGRRRGGLHCRAGAVMLGFGAMSRAEVKKTTRAGGNIFLIKKIGQCGNQPVPLCAILHTSLTSHLSPLSQTSTKLDIPRRSLTTP